MERSTIRKEKAGSMKPPLPQDLKDRAIQGLRSLLPEDSQNTLRGWMKEDPEKWWCQGTWHFAGGMNIRNLLRSKVGILDTELPEDLGWDDYYIEVLEEALLEDDNANPHHKEASLPRSSKGLGPVLFQLPGDRSTSA